MMKVSPKLQIMREGEFKEFMVTAKAIQLDACFVFLMTSPTPPDVLPTFCELLFNVVADSDADEVREQLSQYLRIRRSEKGEQGLLDILLLAARQLQKSLHGNGSDPLDAVKSVTVLLELIQQGLAAAQHFAIPIPRVEEWQGRCHEIARFLEHGRRIEIEKKMGSTLSQEKAFCRMPQEGENARGF